MKSSTHTFAFCSFVLLLLGNRAAANELSPVAPVDRQPLVSATQRLTEAMKFAGAPFSDDVLQALKAAHALDDDKAAVKATQQVLDPLCLVEININAESRVKVKEGPVAKQLMQQGWRAFLVKIHNEAGINPELKVESPNAAPVYQKGKGARQKPRSDEDLVDPAEVGNRWLDVSLLTREPMKPRLSGLAVEYRVLLLYSRDVGKREASLAFNIGQGTQDIGFRNAVAILFDCQLFHILYNKPEKPRMPFHIASVFLEGNNILYIFLHV